MDTRKKKWTIVQASLTLTLIYATVVPGLAQPDPNNVPKAPNPPAAAQGNWGAMTPEQREQAMHRMMEQGLRMFMTGAGFTEKEVQDSIVEFMAQQEKERRAVRDAGRQVVQALTNKVLTDAEVADELANLRAAVDVMKGNREVALAALDAKVQYSKQPRLEAFLTMVGLLGDESFSMSGMMGSMVGLMANMGGGWGGGRVLNPAAPPPAAPAPAPPAGAQ